MKIQINNNEQLELKYPEIVTLEEFKAITTRGLSLIKVFDKFSFDSGETQPSTNTSTPVQIKTYNKRDNDRWRRLRDDRNMVLAILDTYYNKSMEDYTNLINSYNINLPRVEVCSTQFRALREMHKINPKELNLKQFPTKEMPLAKVKL